jgi:hypothetical protein
LIHHEKFTTKIYQFSFGYCGRCGHNICFSVNAGGFSSIFVGCRYLSVSAAIGINGMGWSDLTAILKNPGVECVALCDVDKNVLDKRAAELPRKALK